MPNLSQVVKVTKAQMEKLIAGETVSGHKLSDDVLYAVENDDFYFRGAFTGTKLDSASEGYYSIASATAKTLSDNGEVPSGFSGGGTFFNFSKGGASSSAHAQMLVAYGGRTWVRNRTSTTISAWQELNNAVTSVAGKTGEVTLTASDVGVNECAEADILAIFN